MPTETIERSTRRYFNERFFRLFALTVLALLVIAFVGAVLQFRSVHETYRASLRENFIPHQTELAPELVLNDLDALKDHAGFIRQQQGLDRLVISIERNQIVSTAENLRPSRTVGAFMRVFIGAAPLRIDLSDGYFLRRSYAELEYTQNFFRERVRPVLLAVLATFLLVAGVLGSVFFLVYSGLFSAIIGPIQVMTQNLLGRRSHQPAPTSRRQLFEIQRLNQAIGENIEIEKHRVLTRLARQVVHDIRMPLAALEVGIKQKNSGALDPKLLDRSLEKIRSIVEGLLDPKAWHQNLVFVRIADLCLEVVEEFRARQVGELNPARFEMVCDSETELEARVHPLEFSRVLSNLLQNGLDAYAKRGSETGKVIRILIEAQNDRPEAIVCVSVQDHAGGMSSELVARLGEAEITQGKPGGHGLGIPYVLEAVKSWGGRTEIDSAPGRGTTIRLFLAKKPHESNALGLADGAEVVSSLDDLHDRGTPGLTRVIETSSVKDQPPPSIARS